MIFLACSKIEHRSTTFQLPHSGLRRAEKSTPIVTQPVVPTAEWNSRGKSF